MVAIDSKSDLGCLNKLVDGYNNIYFCSTDKKAYSCWLFSCGWENWDEC